MSLTVPVVAEAQVAIGAAVGPSHQRQGASDSPYLGPGFGGNSLAFVILADIDAGRAMSVGAEVSAAGSISGEQSQRVPGGNNVFRTEHRDVIGSLVAKVWTPAPARVRAAAAGGIGFAQRHTERTGTFRSTFSPSPMNSAVSEILTNTVFAASGGVDLVVGDSQRVGLLALWRIHFVWDDDRRPDGVVRRGVGSIIFRYGVGAQIRF
jgi:hypothetical protein